MYFIKLKFTNIIILFVLFGSITNSFSQNFQGKAYYSSKSSLQFGQWGSKMSEAQKKQIKDRLKNRLEKTYILTFNKEESLFKEDEKLDAISGATDSWGKNFAPGRQYKNIKSNKLIQDQEFYGKKFLISDNLIKFNWELSNETKQIGDYLCFKAFSFIPVSEITWFDFSWDKLRSNENENTNNNLDQEELMVRIEAWYTPQIPISQGPFEYWGLPGLILEVNTENTTILCYKLIINPSEKNDIITPEKGKIVTKKEYQEIIAGKMLEMRDMYRSRR